MPDEDYLKVGRRTLSVRCDGDDVLLLIPRGLLGGWAWFRFRPLEINLPQYAAIFTEHETEGGDEDSPPVDRFTVQLMKDSWEDTIRLTIKHEASFRNVIAFLKRSAPHLEILRGPPPMQWGNDRRPWWRQWTNG